MTMNSKAQLTLEEIEALLGSEGGDEGVGPGGGLGLHPPQPLPSRMFSMLQAHEHVGLLYESEEERDRLVKLFLLAGLRRGEAGIVVHDEAFLERVRTSVDPELSASAAEYPGRLLLLPESEFMLTDGRFDYAKLRERTLQDAASRQGGEEAAHVPLRIVREIVRKEAREGDLPDYLRREAAFESEFCGRHACTALNLFDRGLAPALLKAALSTQPNLVIAGKFYRNTCAMPVARYQRADATDVEIRRIIKRIGERNVLLQREEFLEQVFNNTSLPFVTAFPDGRIMTCNRSFLRLTGYSSEEIRLLNLGEDLTPPEWRDMMESMRSDLVSSHLPQRFEIELERKNGTHVPVQIILNLQLDPTGAPDYLYAFISDASERRASEGLVRAAFGTATGTLPERPFFMDRLGLALIRAKRRLGYRFTVQIIELDRLGLMEDCLGHKPLDALMDSVSSRLDQSVRSLDTPAHFDTNQFAVLLEEVGDATHAIRIAQRVQEEVCKSFHILGCDISMSCRVGIVIGSADYEKPEHVLRDAAAALKRAKSVGGRGIEIFDSLTNDQAVKSLQLESDLQRAMLCNELALVFQPIMDLATGMVAGFEALPRWSHPERGLLYPSEFLPVAEVTGLIHTLEPWVLKGACSQLKAWQQRFGKAERLFVSVNISGKNFLRIGFISKIDEVIEETGLSPNALKIEITERIVMDNPDLAKSVFDALNSREIDLFLDDFGTGSSSLSVLHSLPIDTLKIDNSCVKAVGMIKSIISLAQNLGMNVISEGVETDDELEQLRKLDCRFGQGFLLSRPLSGEDATALLGQHYA